MWVKRICGLIMVIIIFFLTTSCELRQAQTSTTPEPVLPKVGISLPEIPYEHWREEGEYMKQMLEKAGYEVDLQYNNNHTADEIKNIKNMILGGCDLLIICAYDPDSLTTVLEEAKNKNIPVIAYERIIMNSDAVSYLIQVDRWKICSLQLEYIERALGLPEANGPFNMEMFSHFRGDGNMVLSMNTLKSLQAYIASGKINVKSGRIEVDQTYSRGIIEEDREDVRDIFSACNYGPEGTRLDAVWCYSDYQAGIVTRELLTLGYTPENFPIITGADCSIESVKNIIAGTQSMSVHWFGRSLPEEAVAMVIDIFEGNPVEIHEVREYTYDGKYVVPVHLVDPVVVTRDNYKEVLIDTGHYTEDELN